ncbi:MAG: hypothetical protein CML84_01745 [Rhodobiaceae bacterium]|nr:hypothetical protein [Rhodobiaceae bacterium]|tara:strand:+ start:72 stop:1070 length:999 start_codon:yes stop_codon:yes gene_type:complete
MSKKIVIFGGSGFIGYHFCKHILEHNLYENIVLVDICKPRPGLKIFSDKVDYLIHDVRENIKNIDVLSNPSLICNFAAIHREPGHEGHEYYETNIMGAQNVCEYAETENCNNIIFTSSIAPYGLSEKERDESSLTNPNSPYGGSKLVAEKIHEIWQKKNSVNSLLIVRPGVVFGPEEGGNVSRMIKAVTKGYFFYMGNRNTRKAGIYVKELCNAICWIFNNNLKTNKKYSLHNLSMNPGPSIEEYVNAIKKISNTNKYVPQVPFILLLIVSKIIDFIAKPLGISHPFSSVRIKKLVRSNNILPNELKNDGYKFKYTLETSLADWKSDYPQEW